MSFREFLTSSMRTIRRIPMAGAMAALGATLGAIRASYREEGFMNQAIYTVGYAIFMFCFAHNSRQLYQHGMGFYGWFTRFFRDHQDEDEGTFEVPEDLRAIHQQNDRVFLINYLSFRAPPPDLIRDWIEQVDQLPRPRAAPAA